jgi:hypothetical protein
VINELRDSNFMERSNRIHRAIHSFRQSARASFLFPNWITKETGDLFQIKPLLWIGFKWYFYRTFNFFTHSHLAHQYFLECLLLENRLLQITQSNEQWQKNFIHKERQEQLDCFEKILNLYLHETKQPSKSLHTFPEIILVMAQTLEESDPYTGLHEEALKVLSTYENLRSFLQTQTRFWRLHTVQLQETDPVITLLLSFKSAWETFRKTRSVQVKRTSENPALEEIVVSTLENPIDPL